MYVSHPIFLLKHEYWEIIYFLSAIFVRPSCVEITSFGMDRLLVEGF